MSAEAGENVICTIVMVDDDEGHIELFSRQLRRSGFTGELVAFASGSEALDHLHRVHAGAQAQRSTLIVLDVKMPGAMDGVEVLRRMRSSSDLRDLPVVVLSTSNEPRDARRFEALGCDAMLLKPADMEHLRATVARMGLSLPLDSLSGRTSDHSPFTNTKPTRVV